MIKTIRIILPFLLTLLFLAFVSPLFAADFGLLLNQNLGIGGLKKDVNVDYSAALIPHFSLLVGENMELYVSASAKVNYEHEKGNFIPEVLRTDFTWRGGNSNVKAGRMNYSDPLGFIASGLFDGAQYSYESGAGTFSAGVWYTGLLYKETARITMTAEDKAEYGKGLNYDDFFNTFFASRRLLAAFGWEHPALAGFLKAKATVLGQFDLNGKGAAFHSQYIAGKIGVPVENFVFDLGGTFEIAEADNGANTEVKLAYAGEIGVSWLVPTPLPDQLSFIARLASGGTGGDVIAFAPLSTKPQGDILKADFSALSVMSLAYTARFHDTFSAALNASLFLRTDLATNFVYPVVGEKEYFLGSELFTRAFWSPVSDLRINGGCGVFLPVSANTGVSWRIELGVLAALY